MEYLNETTSLLETITRYIKPEMRILISGHRFTYLPLPLIVNSEFTGIVTTLSQDDSYYVETNIDRGLCIKSTEKSRFVYPLPKKSDFVLVSDSIENADNIEDQFKVLQTTLKPGGFMFLIGSEDKQSHLFNIVSHSDFEFIEVFQHDHACYFLVKKGW